MKYEDYRRKLEQDPDYRAAEAQLRPFLDLADDVLRLRLARGWSQEELAAHVGTKQANISRLESGVANPTLKFIERVGRALGAALSVRLAPDTAAAYALPISRQQPAVNDEPEGYDETGP